MRAVNKVKLEKEMSRLAKGDRDALPEIYGAASRLVFSAAYAITANYQDAEDVLQETFLELIKYAESYKGVGAKAFILSITRHLAINVIRKRRPEVDFEHLEYLPAADDYTHLEVFEMLSRLAPEERQIITLRVYAKLKNREAAEIMELPAETAQKKYRRALEKLKKEYGL